MMIGTVALFKNNGCQEYGKTGGDRLWLFFTADILIMERGPRVHNLYDITSINFESHFSCGRDRLIVVSVEFELE